MNHHIGRLTAEVMKLDLSDIEDPREDCVLETDKPKLQRIKRMAEGLEQIQLEQGYTSIMRRTQLQSILKTLKKIEDEAEIVIGTMKRRKSHTEASKASQEIQLDDMQQYAVNDFTNPRSSQKIFLDEFREMEQEFTRKKASALVIQMKSREVRERVEAALAETLGTF